MTSMGRVLPGLSMATAWLLLLLYGPFALFWIIIVIAACTGLYEFFRMVAKDQSGFRAWVPVAISSFPVLGSYYGTSASVMSGLTASLLCLVFFVLGFYNRIDNAFRLLSLGGFATLYIGLCSAHLVLVHALPEGNYWLIILTAITAGSDTGAYYAGRTFGRKKLCPNISPAKTVAGAVGGVCAGVFTAMIVKMLLPVSASALSIIITAPLLVVIGIFGDLVESVMKRAMAVKDSGTLLGGHGGLLDRVDSLLLTAPVLYYLLYFRVLA